MVTYIMLANWTDQGVRNMKESPRRLDAAKKALRDMGGDFKCVYLTMGTTTWLPFMKLRTMQWRRDSPCNSECWGISARVR